MNGIETTRGRNPWETS